MAESKPTTIPDARLAARIADHSDRFLESESTVHDLHEMSVLAEVALEKALSHPLRTSTAGHTTYEILEDEYDALVYAVGQVRTLAEELERIYVGGKGTHAVLLRSAVTGAIVDEDIPF